MLYNIGLGPSLDSAGLRSLLLVADSITNDLLRGKVGISGLTNDVVDDLDFLRCSLTKLMRMSSR